MISLILALAIQTTGDMNDSETIYRANLSASARQELELVEKIKGLRSSIEKLPENWKSAKPEENLLTRTALMNEIESMELTAAERWSVILNNTAFMDKISEPKAFEARRELLNIPKAQTELRRRIEEMSAKIKDEVLVNLASKIQLR